ncbi:MAG: aldehyde dehydrogenase EutE [Elusimicrobia bacterium]|nr:aldehyde dehydrogenase EutE [Elusimicrobiota bacterium]
MPIDENDLKKIVEEVVKNLGESGSSAPISSSGPVFETVDEAVKEAKESQKYFQELGLEKREKIISALREVSRINAKRWAEMAVKETGMGRVEDKIKKNILVSDKTPGVEDLRSVSYTGDKGLTLVEYAPFGVVAAITPSTNAVATIISNAIAILSAGNSVVFSPHPAAKRCVQDAINILDKAVVSAGGPENLITTIFNPTQESTKYLLSHDKINMSIVTGGPAIVKVAMSAGKARKTIAAGPGNPPIVVDETADLAFAAKEIVYGCGFDNNVLCIAEKEVIAVEKIKRQLIEEFRKNPYAYELNSKQIDDLAKIAIPEPGAEPKVNRDFVGRNPSVIAKAIGLNLSDEIRVLWAETSKDHPFVISEQLMPVLPITSASNVDEAIELAYKLEWENHHTSGMYSMNVDNLTRMGRRMACSIFVKNACTLHGLGLGEGYSSMSIGTPTGDGITKPTHFTRPLQCSLVGYFRIA